MFVDSAGKGRNEIWRYLISMPSLLLGLAVSVIFLLVTTTMSQWYFNDAQSGIDALMMVIDAYEHPRLWGEPYRPAEMIFLAAYLISIFLSAGVTAAAVKLVHRRPIVSLLNCDQGFQWMLLWRSLAFGLIGVGSAAAINLVVFGENFRLTSDLPAFLALAAIVLVLVPLQVLGEEIVFRGYILQSTAWFFHNPAVRLVFPAALFFGVHTGGKEISEGGLGYMVEYAMVALYLTWLAIRTDGLEAPLGFHIANNYIALPIVSHDLNSFSVPALFFDTDPMLEWEPLVAAWFLFIHYWFVVRGKFPRDQTRMPVGSSGRRSSQSVSS